MKLMAVFLAAIVAVATGATIEYSNYFEDENLTGTKILNEVKVRNKINKASVRVVGGKQAKRRQFPYQVRLLSTVVPKKLTSFCGGSLISQDFVLTAAHCMYFKRHELLHNGSIIIHNNEYQWAWKAKVYLGFNDFSHKENGSQFINVPAHPNFIVHRYYDPSKALNDIALLHLPQKAVLNEFIKVVNLPPRNIGKLVGQSVIVSGWGHYNDKGESPDVLIYAEMKVALPELCYFYGQINDNQQICFDTKGGSSSCSGDSGGPEVIKQGKDDILVGIVSFSLRKGCSAGVPRVGTRVSYYLDWIQEKTNMNIE